MSLWCDYNVAVNRVYSCVILAVLMFCCFWYYNCITIMLLEHLYNVFAMLFRGQSHSVMFLPDTYFNTLTNWISGKLFFTSFTWSSLHRLPNPGSLVVNAEKYVELNYRKENIQYACTTRNNHMVFEVKLKTYKEYIYIDSMCMCLVIRLHNAQDRTHISPDTNVTGYTAFLN